ncbi:nuclease (plasmid) [Cellulomonas sp. WB94]|uniref:nuclease n=1 Tax=Cellulomonas sp. WB94 TaxID=2173174 RepID=UPI000D564361|nr:nuclease [Cellulomonas sp. WB94]PVU84385.1 nuclease [Cellulomonas sp. WB94]
MPNRIRIDVLPIQEVVAKASPRAWRDGVVTHREQGVLTVALLDGAWWTLATRADLAIGEPVAVHPVAELVAAGPAWYAARPVEA